jgi:uncharacterized membrane protein
MKLTTYRLWRLGFIFTVGIIAAISACYGNVYFLIGAEVVGMIVLLIIRRQVKEIIHDERTYAIAYKAGRTTFSLAALGMATAGAILVTLKRHDLNTVPGTIGLTLLFTTIGILVINLASHYYYSWKLGGRNE